MSTNWFGSTYSFATNEYGTAATDFESSVHARLRKRTRKTEVTSQEPETPTEDQLVKKAYYKCADCAVCYPKQLDVCPHCGSTGTIKRKYCSIAKE